MDDAMGKAIWICVGAVIAAYFTFLTADFLFNGKPGAGEPVIIRDVVGKDEHHLSGTLYVAATCDELSVTYKQVSKSGYELLFETWPEPSVPCKREPSARPFDIVIFAPSSGTHFTASLDNKPLPIAVYPTAETQ
jgi:hypothetical protein